MAANEKRGEINELFEDETLTDQTFESAWATFFRKPLTEFQTLVYHSLFLTSLPWIVQTHGCFSVVLGQIKYGFSIRNLTFQNNGISASDCFEHQLSLTHSLVGDLVLDEMPLLAQDSGAPRVLTSVRTVIMEVPVPTGFPLLATSALEDPDVRSAALPAGILIIDGHMRTVPCIKSMLNNTILLMRKKGVLIAQVRSDHEGNRTIDSCNPFRFTSTIQFEIADQATANSVRGRIRCGITFSKHKFPVALVAQCLGCGPQTFVLLLRLIAGDLYDEPVFRAYEINILHTKSLYPQEYNSKLELVSKHFLKMDLFPHINVLFEKLDEHIPELFASKLIYFVMCVASAILASASLIPLTSRDCWEHSSITTPAVTLGSMIRSTFIMHMETLRNTLRRSLQVILKKAPEDQLYPNLVDLFKQTSLSAKIFSGVKKGKISKKQKKRVEISIQLNDNNSDSILKQLCLISSSLEQTDSVNTGPRQVQQDSRGFGCAASTKDGERKIGLDTQLASTATVSCEVEDVRSLLAWTADVVLGQYLHPIFSFTAGKNGSRKPRLQVLIKKESYMFINSAGIPTHYVNPGDLSALISAFRRARRDSSLPRYSFLRVSHRPRQIRMLCEGGLICRPLVVLENITKLRDREMSFDDLLHAGIVEYIHPAEEQSICKVAATMDDLKHAVRENRLNEITHIEFTEASIVSVLVATIVFFGHLQGPRLAFADQHKTQVFEAGSKPFRGSITSTESMFAMAEIVHTQIASMVPDGKDGRSYVTTQAFCSEDSNQEDAFKTHLACIQRGWQNSLTIREYKSEINSGSNIVERFEPAQNVLSQKNANSQHIETDGLAAVGAFLPGNSVVISKTRAEKRTFSRTSKTKDAVDAADGQDEAKSKKPKVREAATHAVLSTRDISQTILKDEAGTVRAKQIKLIPGGVQARVSVATLRALKAGDKGASRAAQKGVCGMICPTEEMMFDEEHGTIPALVWSAICVGSRMTGATPLESYVAKGAISSGDLDYCQDRNTYGDATQRFIKVCGDYLVREGYKRNGTHWMRDPQTGKRLLAHTFIGVMNYSQLCHIADRKEHFRADGPRDPLTRLPTQGKRRNGGGRFGEQEVAACVSQGAATCLQVRMSGTRRPFVIFVCRVCRTLADGNARSNYAWCNRCWSKSTVHRVIVPYMFHVHLQELQAIGYKVLITLRDGNAHFQTPQTDFVSTFVQPADNTTDSRKRRKSVDDTTDPPKRQKPADATSARKRQKPADATSVRKRQTSQLL